MKEVILFLMALFFIPLVFSISIVELVARYSFSVATQHMNVTGHTDFMADSNGNGINDTLVIELTTLNSAGTFIFAVNLFDENGILTNETTRQLAAGINNVNVTFSSRLLSQGQFNYSIKVYNESRRQKFREDSILTNSYSGYEEGFRVTNLSDERLGKSLLLSLTINSPENKTHVTTLFLKYNDSTIFSKGTKAFSSPVTQLSFIFDNETVKKTHYAGNFTISSIKVGHKALKIGSTTGFHNFTDFASTSYVYSFSDKGVDSNGDNKFDFLKINASVQAFNEGNYTISSGLYDLLGNLIETRNASMFLNRGLGFIPVEFSGNAIHDKKLNGPYMLKSMILYENGISVDSIAEAYTTGNYNFGDFESSGLADIIVEMSVSDSHLFGIGNVEVNFTFANKGDKPAFGLGFDFFDNGTFAKSNRTSLLNTNSSIVYSLEFTNISDLELTAIADLENTVEELNESNNALRKVIRLNKRPLLAQIKNVTLNETDRIVLNLSATDLNGDTIAYSINLSKFSNDSNIFEWNTTVSDAGNYTLLASASDGYLNDSQLFSILILDASEKDSDDDGIADDIDPVIGEESSVNTSNINFSILLNQSRNLSKIFRQIIPVKLMDGSLPMAEFEHNFSRHKLRLNNLTLRRQAGNFTGFVIVRGISMHSSESKTLYLDKVNSTDGICIKEAEISSINEISSTCTNSDESEVECDGTIQDGYVCEYNSTIDKYKVRGLRHSGIIQIDYRKPQVTSGESGSTIQFSQSSSGSSGSSGSPACISNWKCTQWSSCLQGVESRKCDDAANCAFPAQKLETRECHGGISLIKNNEAGVPKRVEKLPSNSMTGHVVGTPESRQSTGIAIIFVETVLIIGAYFLARPLMFK